MKIYIVTQIDNENPLGDYEKIRGVFSTKVKADKFVGPQNVKKTIPRGCCSQQKPNPAYDKLEMWKQKLSIEEWDVE